MVILLGVIGVLCLLGGLSVFGSAKSAVHEIEALIMLLMFVVAVGTAGIIEALRKVHAQLAGGELSKKLDTAKAVARSHTGSQPGMTAAEKKSGVYVCRICRRENSINSTSCVQCAAPRPGAFEAGVTSAQV